MVVVGVGIDLLKISRIYTLIEKYGDRLGRRVLSIDELKQYTGVVDTDHKVKFIANRWALKEAAYKALSQTQYRPTWKQLHIVALRNTPPVITHPYKDDIHLLSSLSHDDGYVTAVVLAQSFVAVNNKR
ncbi:hypothetical protein MIR68_002888 [Amoeboaphelidium protococcarum]|nr:hypothetical protein MIR68_002888 [Amoeboaphelidium protococcarum]